MGFRALIFRGSEAFRPISSISVPGLPVLRPAPGEAHVQGPEWRGDLLQPALRASSERSWDAEGVFFLRFASRIFLWQGFGGGGGGGGKWFDLVLIVDSSLARAGGKKYEGHFAQRSGKDVVARFGATQKRSFRTGTGKGARFGKPRCWKMNNIYKTTGGSVHRCRPLGAASSQLIVAETDVGAWHLPCFVLPHRPSIDLTAGQQGPGGLGVSLFFFAKFPAFEAWS